MKTYEQKCKQNNNILHTLQEDPTEVLAYVSEGSCWNESDNASQVLERKWDEYEISKNIEGDTYDIEDDLHVPRQEMLHERDRPFLRTLVKIINVKP